MEDDENGKKPMKRIDNKKALRVTYIKRKDCVIKKTMELSILCGINVFTLCFGPNGEVDTWPQNPNEVKALIKMYKECQEKPESAMSFLGKLESKLEVLKARNEFLKMVKEQKNRGVVVMGKETEKTSCWFDDTNAIDNLQKNRGVIVMGKETEEACWFDDTSAIGNFEEDDLAMLLEPCYQPQPQQQATQLDFEMDTFPMLIDPCYQSQSQQQATQLNFEMNNGCRPHKENLPQNDRKTGQVGSNSFEEYDDNYDPIDTSPVQLSKGVNDLRSAMHKSSKIQRSLMQIRLQLITFMASF
ncbi:Agamous-like MADS-box protein AGL103 [Camellia lanceoleosa]|uniref:Agamous-like MADS-box protein AGL103 n=1 Tax=Camellia lanceoleosa TaxID=1840588 RepID=A0ACC0FAA3_9ERIC|nr:Agamous-like MADS-box protein AGL103 [Camellia lanceoleosa]